MSAVSDTSLSQQPRQNNSQPLYSLPVCRDPSFRGTPGLLTHADTPHFLDDAAVPVSGSLHSAEPLMMDSLYDDAGSVGGHYEIDGKIIFRVESRNDRLGRTLRVTQKQLNVVGANNIQTRIEVVDNMLPSSPVMFSVKHIHGIPWGRQITVHKNLSLACILAGVPDPPLEIARDAKNLFENTDNIGHMHAYMERVLPKIKFPDTMPQGLRLYWWRAVENGAIVLQNETTGRLILIPNKEKSLISASDALLRYLYLVRHLALFPASGGNSDRQMSANMPGYNFLNLDPDYPVATTSPQVSDSNRILSVNEMTDVVQHWAVDQQVSPWATQLIVKTKGQQRKSQVTHYRYSIDVDPCVPKALSIQVHANEPLSRELHAFPVCMMTMPIVGDVTLQNVYLRFVQGLWFLKKLFDFHCETEGWVASKKGSMNDASPSSASPRTTFFTEAQQQQLLKWGLVQTHPITTRLEYARTSPRTPMMDRMQARDNRGQLLAQMIDTPKGITQPRYKPAPRCVTAQQGAQLGGTQSPGAMKFQYASSSVGDHSELHEIHHRQ